MGLKLILMVTLAITISVPCFAEDTDSQKDKCKQITSCSSCILKSYCVWCVTKSKCTKQECGNDNFIYPDNVAAIMAGPSFCPRVVEPDVLTIKSGARENIIVKITQIHLYMAFTPWKCRIALGGGESVVNALLIVDQVICDTVLFENKSDSPNIQGTVSVLWDYSKVFDGSVPIQVCRCDLEAKCKACK